MSLNLESSYICIILHCSDFSHLALIPTHYPSVVPLPSLSPQLLLSCDIYTLLSVPCSLRPPSHS